MSVVEFKDENGDEIACPKKRGLLAKNHNELFHTTKSFFEDAALMGVDTDALRWMLIDMVSSLEAPRMVDGP